MSGQHAREVVWRISGHDLQTHAFYEITPPDAAEALCGHCVPPARLVDPKDMTARRCIECLLIHGGELADEHGDRHPLMRWEET